MNGFALNMPAIGAIEISTEIKAATNFLEFIISNNKVQSLSLYMLTYLMNRSI